MTMAKFKVGDRVVQDKTADCADLVVHWNTYWTRNEGELTNNEFVVVRTDSGAVSYSNRAGGRGPWVTENYLKHAPLRIEAGKFYRTRDGRKVGPIYVGWPENEHWPFKSRCNDTMYYKEDGYSCPGVAHAHRNSDDLIAEWQDEPAKPAPVAAQVDAIADEYGSGVKAEPKFKVGDRVRLVNGKTKRAEVGAMAVVGPKGVYGRYVDIVWDRRSDLARGQADGAYYPEDFELVTTSNPAIVCLIENGQPKSAVKPFVHASEESAANEAARLAAKHKGQEFGVYVLTSTKKEDAPEAKFKVGEAVRYRGKRYSVASSAFVNGQWQYTMKGLRGLFYDHELTPAKFEHEWQNLAANGQRGAAIRIIQEKTGLSVGPARLAVNAWADAA